MYKPDGQIVYLVFYFVKMGWILMEDINKYYKVPLFEDLEINKKGELRKISNKNKYKYKLHKNNYYMITLKDGSRKPIVPFMFMLTIGLSKSIDFK